MQFRTRREPTPYLNSRDQWRMLRLVGLLALVLVAMNLAADPENWRWMFPREAAPRDQKPQPSLEEVSFGVQLDDPDALPPDVFRSEPDGENERPAAPAAQPDPENCRDVRIDPELLSDVRDNTLGVRRSESDEFYMVLAQARDVPARCLREAARDDVAFPVLMTDSEHFRGVPVTVTGEIRRLNPVDASANPFGMERFYEAWLFTPDSGDNPYRIVTASVPEGLPQGDITDEVRVRATGYFFKREGYAAQGGLHTAPLLIGKTLEPLPARGAGIPAGRNLPIAQYLVIIAAAVIILLGLTLWQFSRGDRRFKREHFDRLAETPAEDPSRLNDLQASDPGEHLRRLAGEEPNDGGTGEAPNK